MTVTVNKSLAFGTVSAPPSKSDAHRCLIAAAMSQGSRIKNVAESEDIKATLNCLKNLGAKVEIKGDTVYLGGLNPFDIPENTLIDCGESGSTLRFLLPLCWLSDKSVTLTGRGRLMERPLDVYEEICENRGVSFTRADNKITVCGRLTGGEFRVRGDISSQFITGLLFTLPLLAEDSKIVIVGNLESEPYINMTLSTLAFFGIKIEKTDYGYYIKGNQRYVARDLTVEGDYSNAAFLDAFNLLGGKVDVTGLKDDSLQGDKIYRLMFEQLKSGIKSFDLANCPDLAPVMFALSAALGGAKFTGTKRLKIKESDRAEAMKQELHKFGINVEVSENSVEVKAGELKAPEEILCGHNDHRIVMSLVLLLTLTGGSIEGAEAVSKSFPDFFEKIKTLNIGFVTDETR
ncbi:MAG: 3-phosphoshikimate 1-carboxyvinyltransferase [Clostridia bacterium]|nr:3-phosphoshikimate 1-carboxyvinyltransferase [Clostridia bacterium]